MKFRYFLAALFLSLAVGCVQEEIGTLSEIQVSESYVSIDVNGGSASVNVTASESWQVDASSVPSWLTVSPMSGAAGNAQVTFSAESTKATNKAEVKIVCAGQTQYVNVIQYATKVDPPISTAAQVIAGDDGVTFRMSGVCSRYDSGNANAVLYGNWYITDETGTVYIYGTLDKKGQTKGNPLTAWGIEVGDHVVIEGPKSTYNGTVELVDVTVISITKSLISVGDFDFDELPCTDTTFNMTVSAKESPILVTSDSDWLQIVDVNADGSYKLHANANDRTAKRTATISIKGPTALKSVEIAQTGTPATGASITEIVAADDDDQVQTLPNSVVVALTTRGAVLSDGTSAIYAYGNSAAALKLGDGVKMSARKTTYNGVPELTDITDVFVDSEGNAVSYPDAKDITASVETYEASVAEYIKFSGTLTVSGNYFNIAFDDVDPDVKQGSIVYPIDALDAKSFDGKKITVTGYFNGLSSKGKFVNVVATKIQEFVDNPKGTLRNPYEATEIASLIKGGTIPEGKVYVRGIINKIDNVNTSYGNAQYWLSTDGATADFEAYRSYYYGGEKWTEDNKDAIKEGDEVLLYGEVTYYAANDVAEFKQGNYLVTINGKALPEGDGTEASPYNVTKLAEMLLAGETFEGEVYAKGLISQIDNVNLQYGNAQYWISDDGTKLFQMEIYRGFWFGGEKFTSEDQIALGDEVVVFGKVKVYKETPEFDANNKIISLNGKTE